MSDRIAPSLGGYVWRPPRLSDAPAIAEMTAAMDKAENLDLPGGPDSIREDLSRPELDLDQDAYLAITPDGSVGGYAVTLPITGDGSARIHVWLEVHPDHTEVESTLIEWAIRRGKQQAADIPAEFDVKLRVGSEEHRHRRRRVLAAAGFRHVRTFIEMRRPLGGPMAVPPPPPDGVKIVDWSDDLDEAARLASNAAFADHWGSVMLNSATWRASYAESDSFRPRFSFLALAGDHVVSICYCSVEEEYNEQQGVKEMWIERVATRPEWRRRGLATALISRSLVAGAAAGMERAGLDVDEDSGTYAPSVYQSLGFKEDRRSVQFEMPIDR